MASFATHRSFLDEDFGHEQLLPAFWTGQSQDGQEAGSLTGASTSNTMGSFDEWMHDLSPQITQPMDFNSSDGPPSDLNFGSGSDSALEPFSQMSADETLRQPNYLLMANAAQFIAGNSNVAFDQPNTSMMPFGQVPAYQTSPSQFGQTAHNHSQNTSASHGYPTQSWINGPQIKRESLTIDDIYSSGPTPQQHMFHAVPWTSENPQRFTGQALPHHPAWGPAGTSASLNPNFGSYAPSVRSSGQESSPLIDGMTTPESSNRSPMFSTAVPHSSGPSSNGGDGHRRSINSFDQTHRGLQTSFPMQQGFVQQNQFLSPTNVSPQHLMIDTSGLHQLQREPTHSPFSDFVMVDKLDAVPAPYAGRQQPTQPKPKRSAVKRSRVAPTNKTTGNAQKDMFVSEHPSHTPGPIRRQSNTASKATKASKQRSGGRQPGMHLNDEAAARAKQLRDEGSCWICCFQRDSCSPGVECDRCQKRQLRSQMEHGLGCDRTKLNDLRPYFIPDFLARSGDKSILSQFMDNHIQRWGNQPMRIRINVVWGQDPMELELYEFIPKGAEISRHLQNTVVNKQTGKRDWQQKGSPPLAMVQIDSIDRRAYDKYIDDIVDNKDHLENFVDRNYRFENDNFQRRLFRLMFEYEPTDSQEKTLCREIMRLQVITYIYCRASTIVNEDLPLLSQLSYTRTNHIRYEKSTTIRLANRQLKYLYTSLWKQIMENVLKRLQQVLRSSSGGNKWSSGFVAVLGLGMAFEAIQLMAHAHQEADLMMGNGTEWGNTERAERACRVIDEKFFFLTTLFRWKYHRGFNPFKNIHDREMHKTLGPNALQLVQGVNELVAEKIDYLNYREQIPILSENKEKYTSRLVAKFLMGFWKPSA